VRPPDYLSYGWGRVLRLTGYLVLVAWWLAVSAAASGAAQRAFVVGINAYPKVAAVAYYDGLMGKFCVAGCEAAATKTSDEPRPEPRATVETARTPTEGLIGSVWTGLSGTRSFTFKFLEDGILEYTSPTGTFRNAKWTQDGNLVVFNMNNGYAIYDGKIAEGSMEGTAKNKAGSQWTWQAKRQ
jgi:hypothetical protein